MDWAMILGKDNYDKFVLINGPRTLTTIPWRGTIHNVRPSKQRRLIGWRVGKRERWYSDLVARDGILRTLLIYEEGNPEPLDRLSMSMTGPDYSLTPQIHRTYFTSKLLRDRMRKFKIGPVDIKLVLIALGILGIVIAILYFGGYFG